MDNICPSQLCTGCSACSAVCPQECITMTADDEGFLRPVIDDRLCIDCNACADACPQNHPITKSGPQQVYAGWSRDQLIRTSSSSGGAFHCLAESIIRQGGVVFGAVLCDDMVIRHIPAESIECLAQMRGSKYAQSEMGNCIPQIRTYLSQGRKVLFSGTPCQIAGIRAAFGASRPEELYLVDIVCHGVPSQSFFRHYIDGLKERYPQMEEKSFQFRTLGQWNAIPNAVVSGERKPMRGHDSIYTKLFLKNLIHRESCYHCTYACPERVSDITIADFWGIGEAAPFEYDTDQGCSLLMVNSTRGSRLFGSVSDTFFACSRPLEEAVAGNAQLQAPSPRPAERDGIYAYLLTHTLDEIEEALIPKKK